MRRRGFIHIIIDSQGPGSWQALFVICTLISIFCSGKALAAPDTSVTVALAFPNFQPSGKLSQEIFSRQPSDKAITGTLSFQCFYLKGAWDSVLVYGQRNRRVSLTAGVQRQHLHFGYNDSNNFVHPGFFNILKKTGTPPAGSYRLYVSVVPDSLSPVSKQILLQADTLLQPTNSVSKKLDDILAPERRSNWLSPVLKTAGKSFTPVSKVVDQQSGKISKVIRAPGLTQRIAQKGDKIHINLYYEEWFVGRYELDATKSVESQVNEKKQRLAANLSSAANTELEGYKSLFSQVRELAKSEQEDQELKGELALSGNWSNGQPEYSAQDNNYYEVRGHVQTEVADIPVSVEGYYTTQDAHRQVKGSFIRFHYDADRARSKLQKLISGYRNKYEETVSKGKGLEQIYGSYLSSLESKKSQAIYDLKQEAGWSGDNNASLDTSGLRAAIEASLINKMKDSSVAESQTGHAAARSAERARQIKDSADRVYHQAVKRYAQVKEIEAQIQKYSRLLEQYRNTSYFDSALAYSKIQSLSSGDDISYKQMARSAAALLPEGKAKTFTAGLTKLDAGIINQYTSKYTAAGQQMKGIDLGYDIGFAEWSLAVGTTEYAGRDGGLDKYSTYSSGLKFRPGKGQKASLIYYGYTPSKSYRNDEFFKGTDLSLPSFRSPVHILSALYESVLAKTINVETEIAGSYRSGTGPVLKNSIEADHLAWHINADGKIPATPLTAVVSYEHSGRYFANSTLPVNLSGTDLYKAGIKGSFFKEFLTAKVEFNQMEQQRLSGTGGNNRWGFELATHSKQYPSVSLAYKPFATFRTANDTLAVPQRPLQGSIWTGKASYQLKLKGGVSYRFSAVFNKSTSHNDSLSYGSDLLQFNASYNDRRWMAAIAAGQSKLQNSGGGNPSDSLYAAHIRTTFFNLSGSRSFTTGLSLNGGLDIGFAPYGLSRAGANAGFNYRLQKIPLSIRSGIRYGAYKLPAYSGDVRTDISGGTPATQPMEWRHLVSGTLELIWQFRMKINEQ